ncbi:MAG TPA: hypothetical protein GXZ90_05145 [Clostridiales bacterium]|nr:hypothetical protein [Clostridiales bacterium]
MWNNLFGLNTILPEKCYPLQGNIIITDIKTDKPELIGEFTVNKLSDTIHVKSNMNKYFSNKCEMTPINSDIHVESIQMDTNLFPSTYKYLLTSDGNGNIELLGVHFSGVELKGIAKVNTNMEISFSANESDVSIELQPVYKDKMYCDMRVW